LLPQGPRVINKQAKIRQHENPGINAVVDFEHADSLTHPRLFKRLQFHISQPHAGHNAIFKWRFI
jgi:hypothetical protein